MWEGLKPQPNEPVSVNNPPWKSVGEPELRKFLLERARDGFAFPINPVWPIRNPGWYEVLQAVRGHAEGKAALDAWFPPESGVIDSINELHKAHPDGHKPLPPPPPSELKKKQTRSQLSLVLDLSEMDALDMAAFVDSEVKREIKKRWRRIRKLIIQELIRQGREEA